MLLNSTGCDSVLTFHLTVLPKPDVPTTYFSINVLTASLTGVSYQWVKCPGSIPIPGETGKDFHAKADGYYGVIVFNGVCSDTSDCNYIKGLNINETDLHQNNSKLYPNPFSNTATLEFDNPQNRSHHLSVFNTFGQLVLSIEQIRNNTIRTDRKELQSGLYF